jgi:hypothetical protein
VTSHRLLSVALALLGLTRPAVAQGGGNVRNVWQGQATDRGRGLVYLRDYPVDGGKPDTLLLRTAPRGRSPLRGYFICESRGEHGWAYVVVASDSLVPNVLEFAYEVAGLPIDSITPDRAWARALYGVDGAGRLLTAWVQLDSTIAGWLWWEEYLPARGGLYLIEPSRATFVAGPRGRALPSPLTPKYREGDHWLEVLGRQGPWLRARFTQPAALCGAEVPPEQVSDTLWLRFLDLRGRPLVWYFTRGC